MSKATLHRLAVAGSRGRRWCGPKAVAPAKVSQSRLSEPIGSSMSITAGMAARRRRRIADVLGPDAEDHLGRRRPAAPPS